MEKLNLMECLPIITSMTCFQLQSKDLLSRSIKITLFYPMFSNYRSTHYGSLTSIGRTARSGRDVLLITYLQEVAGFCG